MEFYLGSSALEILLLSSSVQAQRGTILAGIPSPLESSCHKFFSSSHGRKMGRVVGYSTLAFRRIVPSSFLSGYVARRIGSCSLIGFSKLLGVTMKKTSYCILIIWHPLRLVGGRGGTKSCSDFQSSV